MVPTNFQPILVNIFSQQSISQKGSWQDTKIRSFPPSTKSHPLFFFSCGPCLPYNGWVAGQQGSNCSISPSLASSYSCIFCGFLLSCFLFTRFLPLLILSCFFICFLSLWLYKVSPCFTSAESKFILIPLYKGIMGFLPNIGLGLLTYFAFFSLHLFTTLGQVCLPICFIFSSYYIGLGLLTHLLHFLFF